MAKNKYGSGPSWGNLFDSLVSSTQDSIANTGANIASTAVSTAVVAGESVQALSSLAEASGSFGDALLLTAPKAMFTEVYAHALGDGSSGISSVVGGSSPEYQQSLFDSADAGVAETQRLILEGSAHGADAAEHKMNAEAALRHGVGTSVQTPTGLLFGESGNIFVDPYTAEQVDGFKETATPTAWETAQAALLLVSLGGATGLIRPVFGLVPSSFYAAIAGDATLHAVQRIVTDYLLENPGVDVRDMINDVKDANPEKPLWVMKYSDYEANGRKPPLPYTIGDPGLVIPDNSPKWDTYEYGIHAGRVPEDMSREDYESLREESARKAKSGEGLCINLTPKRTELATSAARLVAIGALQLTIDASGVAEDGSASFSLHSEKVKLTTAVAELEEYIRSVLAGEMEHPACL